MLPLSRPIETRFVTRSREIPHAVPKLFSTLLAAPEAAVTPAISEVEVVAGAEVGGMTAGTGGETVTLISGIGETPPIGMIEVESVSAPTGATVTGIALGDVGPPLVHVRHSQEISETRETHAMVPLAWTQTELGVAHEMGHFQLAPLPLTHPSRIRRTEVIRRSEVGMAGVVGGDGAESGIVAAAVHSTTTGIDTEAHFDLGLKRVVFEIGTTVNEKTGIPMLICAHAILEMTEMPETERHDRNWRGHPMSLRRQPRTFRLHP